MLDSVTRHAIGTHLRAQWSGGKKLLDSISQEPRRHQQRALLGMLAANAGSRYGRDHGFAGIRSIADFQAAVPINSYEDLRPYVDQVVSGATGIRNATVMLPQDGREKA